MIKHFCDICKEETTKPSIYWTQKDDELAEDSHYESTRYEMCRKCNKKITKFFNQLLKEAL